jgi:hypothetical protein
MIPHTKLFNDNSQIVKLANIIFVLKTAKYFIIDTQFGDFSAHQGFFHKFG